MQYIPKHKGHFVALHMAIISHASCRWIYMSPYSPVDMLQLSRTPPVLQQSGSMHRSRSTLTDTSYHTSTQESGPRRQQNSPDTSQPIYLYAMPSSSQTRQDSAHYVSHFDTKCTQTKSGMFG